MRRTVTRPCGALHFKRDKTEKSIYHVCYKEGKNIPDLCGKSSDGQKFLILGIDFMDDEDGTTFLLHTTNQNALGADTDYFYQDEEMLRVARFRLTPERRATVNYGTYVLLIDFNPTYDSFTIRFLDGLGGFAPNVLVVWEQGLLEDRVA